MSASTTTGTVSGPTVLLLLDALPLPLTEGDRLRSYYLARAQAEAGRCVLAAMKGTEEQREALLSEGPFDEILMLPSCSERGSFRRHLRTDNGHYLRWGWPAWFDACTQALRRFVAEHEVTVAIAGKLTVAELVAVLDVHHRVVDDFDCYTLTLEREYALHARSLTLPRRFHHLLAQHRYARQESRLSERFALITTISPTDGARLRALDPRARVEIVPNGVEPGLLDVGRTWPEARSAGVAFWGNLAFEPNRSAVQWFIDEVYAPWLAAAETPCYLIGGGADEWIRRLPERFPKVRVTGFVEDLPALVQRVPVMVNPMVSGSGLKNKMLEAMAMGRAVVSTRMGSEALAAHPERHFLLADRPERFAQAVLDLHAKPQFAEALGTRARELVASMYTWPSVITRWRDVLASVETAAR
ncbi:MAG: glycosyltransferase family 4 protein [Pseudomonadota bacterium]